MGIGTVFTRVSEMLAIATCLFHIQTLWASKMLRGTILLPRTIPGMWLMGDYVLYFTSLSLDPSHAMGGHLPYACQKHSAKWPLSFLSASAFLCPDLSAVGWPQSACYPTSVCLCLSPTLYKHLLRLEDVPSPYLHPSSHGTHTVPHTEKAHKDICCIGLNGTMQGF